MNGTGAVVHQKRQSDSLHVQLISTDALRLYLLHLVTVQDLTCALYTMWYDVIFALLKHRVWYVQIAELRPADDGYGFVDVPTELPGVVSVAMLAAQSGRVWLLTVVVVPKSVAEWVMCRHISGGISHRVSLATRAAKQAKIEVDLSTLHCQVDIKAHCFVAWPRFNRNHRVRDSPLDSPEQPTEYLHQTRGKLEARVGMAAKSAWHRATDDPMLNVNIYSNHWIEFSHL